MVVPLVLTMYQISVPIALIIVELALILLSVFLAHPDVIYQIINASQHAQVVFTQILNLTNAQIVFLIVLHALGPLPIALLAHQI